MKRFLSVIVLLAMLLSGCSGQQTSEQKQYTATFLTLFDTVTSITGKADNEASFREKVQPVHDALMEYHQLFDIYNEYDGLNNLKTVNDQAGISPVSVDDRIIALLKDCKAYFDATGGRVNAAMGSVLQLWHEARNNGLNDPANAYLPDFSELKKAQLHTDFSSVILDEAASTVFFTDPELRLDVGAIAKGWSVQRVCESAPDGLLISVGGNVCATGAKDAAGNPWVIGIQDPDDAQKYLHTLRLHSGSVVTSGDYQRVYWVEGEAYHHIIDPQTLYPSKYWQSVTIVCEDSGLADALSTALFVLSQEEGQQLLNEFDAKAMWVDVEGNCFYSPGFEDLIRT